jgi:hypothetical protein
MLRPLQATRSVLSVVGLVVVLTGSVRLISSIDGGDMGLPKTQVQLAIYSSGLQHQSRDSSAQSRSD